MVQDFSPFSWIPVVELKNSRNTPCTHGLQMNMERVLLHPVLTKTNECSHLKPMVLVIEDGYNDFCYKLKVRLIYTQKNNKKNLLSITYTNQIIYTTGNTFTQSKMKQAKFKFTLLQCPSILHTNEYRWQ